MTDNKSNDLQPGPSAQGAGHTPSTCDVGIVCALNIEIAPLLERAKRVNRVRGGEFTFYGVTLGSRRIAIVETGAGRIPSQRGTHALLDGHNPPWVLSTGLSGGLTPETVTGDIVVASSVSLDEPDGTVLNVGQQRMEPQPGVHVGRLVTTRQIVRLVSEKRALQQRTDALAVDMESYHVARICVDRSKPFAAIRCLSDDLSADLPPEILGIMGPKGTVRAGAVLGALWHRPGCVTDLWSLRDRALKSGERLAKFLVKLLD